MPRSRSLRAAVGRSSTNTTSPTLRQAQQKARVAAAVTWELDEDQEIPSLQASEALALDGEEE
ncbi:MAG: hypothetical protein AB2A00_31765 [Myxococcota bacterium]